MANPEHFAILQKGVDAWNEWRDANREVKPDLRFANIYQWVQSGMNLSGAKIGAAILLDKSLSNIDFRGADLSSAVMIWSGIRGTDFTGANLVGTNFTSSDLSGSNFTGAELSATVFGATNLRSVIGLETCVHRGSSVLDHQTLSLSGTLPLTFLRGCGLPDNLIEYLPSLLAQAISFYSCFISYSTRSQEFAERLHADLQNRAVRCWFAPEDLKIGDPFRQRIDESIRLHDKVLLILSEHSVQSPWVEDEVEASLERERREKRLVLFPIRIDDAVLATDQAWAASIRRNRNIGDFSGWKDHDTYQKAFERLLRDLKPTGHTK